MLQKLTISSFLGILALTINAQDTIVMPTTGNGGFYNSCYAVVYDNGLDSNYQNYSNSTVTISPLWVENISLYFEEFNTEPFFDTLSIYDGPGVAFPKIGAFSGNSLQGQTVTSTGNSITLEFQSDDIQTGSGFVVWVSCLMGNEDNSINNLLIYPNPVSATLFLSGIDLGLIGSIDVTDITGKVIRKMFITNSIEVTDLSPGIYGLMIYQKNGFRYFKKWIKE